MRVNHVAFAGVVLAAGVLSASIANAGDLQLWAGLSPGDENPPTEGGGNGFAEIHLNTDTLELSWYLEFHDLTSPAIAAHFHGPAQMDENADVVIDMEPVSGSTGSLMLTPEEAQVVTDGLLYINVHTEKYPDGEIRGQVR